eukprot:scaffold20946_cov110-Isochrysis_galbana.AAC.1
MANTIRKLEQAAGEKGGQKAAGEGGIIIGKKKGEAAPQSRTDIIKLRSAIQTLCQSCNPLGRCLEYVHEDLEAMAKELEQWKALRRRKMAELAEEEAKTEASLFGLQQELAMAEQDVADKRAQIRFFKASVVKNDGAVEKLLASGQRRVRGGPRADIPDLCANSPFVPKFSRVLWAKR